jgi:hypothetical protein
MKGPGYIQRALARAFRACPYPLTTRELLAWTNPRARLLRERRNRARVIRRVADRMAIRVRRTWPDGWLWQLRKK